ncbi:MAG: hypothetical protein GXO76_02640 [Calditrichaeota bacterium]|nr:hypothetical protein [Calditrichota bacterium]
MKLLVLVLFLFPVLTAAQEECTVGVAVGKATIDGKPLLWKNRDSRDRNNSIHFFTRASLPFMAVIKSGDTTKVWMGVNSAGFAIMNSSSKDLEGEKSSENGIYMKKALETCRSVDDFGKLLYETNIQGRKTRSNFGVIDALGDGAIFETGSHSFVRFDAKDSPYGYIVRANFSVTGTKDSLAYGYQRWARANLLWLRKAREKALSYRYILRTVSRDLVNESAYPYPLPFSGRQDSLPKGVLRTQNSINRFKTVSVVVFHGVILSENPALTTMWVILGEPICGIAFPVWPVDETLPPAISEGNPPRMNRLIQEIEALVYPNKTNPGWLYTPRLKSAESKGILPAVLAAEDSVFSETETWMDRWQTRFRPDEMKTFQKRTVNRLVRILSGIIRSHR